MFARVCVFVHKSFILMPTNPLSAIHAFGQVSEFAKAEKAIADLSTHMLVLSGTVDMPSENMLISMLRTMFSRTPRLAPLFNIYDLNPSTSPG